MAILNFPASPVDNQEYTNGILTYRWDAAYGLWQVTQFDQAPRGIGATITVGSVLTLDSDLVATVTNVGDSADAIFDFGIPQGIRGLSGADGSNGTNGVISDSSDYSYYHDTVINQKEFFSAYDNTGGTNINAIADVIIDTTFKNSNASVFTLASNILTINKTATFSITYDVSTDVSSGTGRSGSRSELQWRVNSGGTFAFVDGTYGFMYNRSSITGEVTCSVTIIKDLTAGNQLKIRAQRYSGADTIVTLADGSRLTLIEL